MRILFLVPPVGLNGKRMTVDRVYGCNYGFDYKPAIHLLLMCTQAKRSGYDAEFLDCPARGFGVEKLREHIRNFPPDIVVFFTVWLSLKEDIASADLIAKVAGDAGFIFTGPYPSWKPELFLKDEHRFVIRGECEKALLEFIGARSARKDTGEIKNLSFYGPAGFSHNESRQLDDIDTLFAPDRRMLKGAYSFNRLRGSPATVLCVSRGCSYGCGYCAPHALDQAIEIECNRSVSNKPLLRLRNIDKVCDEFADIASLGYKAIEICDNQFVWDVKRTMEICDRIRGLKMEWICYARADHLKDRGMVRLMREAGCALIYIGTESFCQEILDDIGKTTRLSDIYKAVELVRDCGIEPEISVLLGASGLETEKTISLSAALAKKLSTKFVHYSIACPLPNTRLYALSKQNGWLKAGEFIPGDNISKAQLDLPFVSALRLEKMVRRCYLSHYFSVKFIISQVLSINTISALKSRVKAFLNLVRYAFGG